MLQTLFKLFGQTKRNGKKNQGDYDLVFELHFNAANTIANGCEAIYYYFNKKTKHLFVFSCLK